MSASGTQNRMVPSQKNRGARLRALTRYPRQRSRPTNWQVGRSGSTHRRAARSGAVDRSRASRPAHGASASAQSPRVRLAAPALARPTLGPPARGDRESLRAHFFILPPRGGSPRGAEASTMGGAFTPRTEAQKAAIPMPADATVALVAATCASISVAPFLMCVDRGVVAAAAGNAPGGSLFRAIGAAAGEFVTKPKVAFGQPAVWIVAAVYGGTYFAKNFADVLIERRGLSESRAAGTAKFCATTATNMGGSILKDAAFARWFGAAAAAAAAPAVIPKTSYALFAARDCLTISGAFVVPDAMRAALHARAERR